MNITKTMLTYLLNQLNIKFDEEYLNDEYCNTVLKCLTEQNKQIIQTLNKCTSLSAWPPDNEIWLRSNEFILKLTPTSATIRIRRTNRLKTLYNRYNEILNKIQNNSLKAQVMTEYVEPCISCYEYFQTVKQLYIKPTFSINETLTQYLNIIKNKPIYNELNTVYLNKNFDQYIDSIKTYYTFTHPKLVVSYGFTINDKYIVSIIPAGCKISISLTDNENNPVIYTLSIRKFNTIEDIIQHLLYLIGAKHNIPIQIDTNISAPLEVMIVLTALDKYFNEYQLINEETALELLTKTDSIYITDDYNLMFVLPKYHKIILYKAFSIQSPRMIIKRNNRKIYVPSSEIKQFLESL